MGSEGEKGGMGLTEKVGEGDFLIAYTKRTMSYARESIVFPSEEEFSRFEIVFFDKVTITSVFLTTLVIPNISVFLEQADHSGPFLDSMDLDCDIGFDFQHG